VLASRLLGRMVLALALGLALAVSACASEPRVVIHTAKGDVAVTVEVAATRAEQQVGLMYRKELGAMAGMLFVFDTLEEHSFWMKNTVLPLDMLFIDDDKKIVGIVKDAVPFTTSPRTVGVPSRYVLEVNAGFAAKHGVAPGDTVSFERIPAAP
jgi:uncharacterized membrane protein (UPF0127 family)